VRDPIRAEVVALLATAVLEDDEGRVLPRQDWHHPNGALLTDEERDLVGSATPAEAHAAAELSLLNLDAVRSACDELAEVVGRLLILGNPHAIAGMTIRDVVNGMPADQRATAESLIRRQLELMGLFAIKLGSGACGWPL